MYVDSSFLFTVFLPARFLSYNFLTCVRLSKLKFMLMSSTYAVRITNGQRTIRKNHDSSLVNQDCLS